MPQLCFLLLSALGLLMGACNAMLIVPMLPRVGQSASNPSTSDLQKSGLTCASCYPCSYKNSNYSFPTCSVNATLPDQTVKVSRAMFLNVVGWAALWPACLPLPNRTSRLLYMRADSRASRRAACKRAFLCRFCFIS